MNPLGRSLVLLGLLIAAAGVLVAFADKIPFIGRLPGDFLVKRDHVSFYFPLTTCIVISLLLTLASRFFGRK